MAEAKQEFKFPTETVDLPSGGKVYSKDSPLSSGKIDVKYMTAKEEDILTSQNLIKKGVVVETLIDSLIVTPGVKNADMVIGDKNAVMVAARILAYGSDYEAEVTSPTTGETVTHTFNLADCPFKKIPKDVDTGQNEFTVKLPVSKAEVVFKVLYGRDETAIDKEIKSHQKLNVQVAPELTTRLKHSIISVDGDVEKGTIYNFVNSMLSKDSLFLRKEMVRVSPDIELRQEIEIGGEAVDVNIPLTVEFFWPKTN